MLPAAGFSDQHYYLSDTNTTAMRKMEDIESSGIYDQVGPPCESKLDYQFHAAALHDEKSEVPAIPPPRCGNAYEAPDSTMHKVGGTKRNGPSPMEALDTYDVPTEVGGATGTMPSVFLQSEDYEVPLETKTNTLKQDVGVAKTSGSVRNQESRSELEVSSAYDTPLDAAGKGEKEAATKRKMTSKNELEVSNVYDTPLDAAEKREEEITKMKESATEELEQEYTPMASVWSYTQYKKT